MTMINKLKSRFTIGLIAVLGLMGISTELNDFEIAKNLEIFSNIYRELNTFYVDEVDPEYLMETGVNAMLNSLDPYTTYIPADEVAQFRSTITGKYGGVGASIIQGKEYVTISLPYEGSPAQRAGLQVGDKMVEIDGKNVKGKTINEVSSQMRGAPNTTVQLKVKRLGEKDLVTINLTREEIKVSNTPYYGVLDNQMGYIVLSTFSENAGKNVANALKDLKSKHDLKGVILDLRGNTGGLLTEAVNVTNVFVDKGAMVVQIKGRDRNRQQIFRTLNESVDSEIPLSVLIDGGSASASEIVAGAIQDLDRGVIIGQRSYGKGLVQNTKDLSFGAKVKLTTARYYVPSGRCIQALRYKDGKPEQIPDSLRVPYLTSNKRPVYDGGGINPDIALDKTAFLKIFRTLRRDLLVFDYANQYKVAHPIIAKAGDFLLTDKDFDNFLAFLTERNYVYETEVERLLSKLEDKTEKEAYAEQLKDELASVKKLLMNSRQGELKKEKGRLMHLLQRYIAMNYYFEKGGIEAGATLDLEIKKAIEVLNNKETYQEILQPKK